MQNITMAVVNILTGLIVDSKGYFVIEIFFLSILYGKHRRLNHLLD